MPRQSLVTTENSFRNGLVTEATGLNFPENACVETYNCVFDKIGSVYRRKGFDFEAGYQTKTIDRTQAAVNSFLWKAVGGNANINLFVLQVGRYLYFWKVTNAVTSQNALATTVDLNTYKASGSPDITVQECQFDSGLGYLFVSHPYCDPIYVTYNEAAETVSANVITLKIRDFEGLNSGFAIDNRPTSTLAGLTKEHNYNLRNQGWTTTNLTTWDTNRTDMPSNADVMWLFKNSSDVFDTNTVANVMRGNSPAPKGKFILDLHSQDRTTISGVAGITTVTSSYYRASVIAFFAGRVWYTGVNYGSFTNKVYFSQIIERNEQFGQCYQQNDPTSEDAYDLLPSDGGVISIPDMGTVIALYVLDNQLLVFASNGIWSISGSEGIGFRATDYAVNKISAVGALSATSFVDINGLPTWWNSDGIYAISSQGNGIGVKPLSDARIKTFYMNIPLFSRKQARGYYNPSTNIVQWLYRETEAATTEEAYDYDRVLNYNVVTEAFYPWTLPDSTCRIHDIVALDSAGGTTVVETVVDNSAQTVQNDAGQDVLAYRLTQGLILPQFKYICSYPNSGSYKFTFAEERNADYYDWPFYETSPGLNYDSYFVTGYKLHGQALNKFQTNHLRLYMDNSQNGQYFISGRWDYSTHGDTGRWTSRQKIITEEDNYRHKTRRIIIRGQGLVLQYKVESCPGYNFNISGWVGWETANQSP